MFSFDLFRSLNPATNPIGFGASDFLELLFAFAILFGALVAIPYVQALGLRLAAKTKQCMLLLAVLPVVLRLALLAHHPVPTPNIGDEFSHLLVADTLRHFRLANVSHPFHRFFETFFVLQQPSHSSIYPIGQGIPLALGWMIFGLPWAGVVLSTAAFCSLCYWMLRGWTTPGWALIGGLLAVFEFGPLCLWMNDYWGGSFAAAAGCLVFGALPRLAAKPRVRDAALLGAGFGMHLLTRPFESVALALSVALFFIFVATKGHALGRPAILRLSMAGFVPVFFSIAVVLLQNHAVTDSWRTVPYALSQYQYGVPASLTVQSNPLPHNALTPEQQTEYEIQLAFKPKGGETITTFFERLVYRVHYYRFFFLPPLYLALAAFLCSPKIPRWRWIVITLASFSFWLNLFPAFQFHYFAAVTCVFVLVSVAGLERISRLTIRTIPVGAEAARWLVILCVAHFTFWYTVHALESWDVAAAMLPYDTWNVINHGNPERRIAVARQLAGHSGKKLVFVRYYANHPSVEEWVWNEADIDGARIVWARDLGPEENEKLRKYYPNRTAWMLEPDFRPMPRLSPYVVEKPAELAVPVAPATKSPFETPGFAPE